VAKLSNLCFQTSGVENVDVDFQDHNNHCTISKARREVRMVGVAKLSSLFFQTSGVENADVDFQDQSQDKMKLRVT
jgi:hypothetical protein